MYLCAGRRAQHAHDLDERLFFGLLFLENLDLSQFKKPPFAFNSNSTGKWSLTPSACKTTAQGAGISVPALAGCAVLGCGEVAMGHCTSWEGWSQCPGFTACAVFSTAWALLALCSHVSPVLGLCCAYLLLSHLKLRLEIKDVGRVWHHSLDELLSTDHNPARDKEWGL